MSGIQRFVLPHLRFFLRGNNAFCLLVFLVIQNILGHHPQAGPERHLLDFVPNHARTATPDSRMLLGSRLKVLGEPSHPVLVTTTLAVYQRLCQRPHACYCPPLTPLPTH